MFLKIFRIFFIGLSLGGCTKAANMAVQALSTTLVQLKTSSPSPFNQNFDIDKYAVFKGQCLNIITTLQISLDDSPWVNVPLATAAVPVTSYTINGSPYSYSEAAIPMSVGNYDIDCSDGTFNFWIYEHQIDEMIFQAFAAIPSINRDPNKVSIRGVSGSYTTEPTEFISNHTNNNIATKLELQKFAPSTGALLNQCVELVALLKGDNGQFASYSTSDLILSVTHQINSISEPSPSFYSDGSCSPGGLLNSAGIKILKDRSEFRFHYRMPASAVGDIHQFIASFASSPPAQFTVTQAPISFPIKADTDLLVDIFAPWKIVEGVCYPVSVNFRKYDNSFGSLSQNETFSIVSDPAAVAMFFFEFASNCASSTGPITGLSLPTGTGNKDLFLKLPSGSLAGGKIIVNRTTTGSTVAIESGMAYIDFDRSGGTTASQVQIRGYEKIFYNSSGGSQPYHDYSVSLTNSLGTPLPVAAGTTVGVSLDVAANGNICSFDGIICNPASVTISAGNYRAGFKFQPNQIGSVTLIPDFTGLLNINKTITVYSP